MSRCVVAAEDSGLKKSWTLGFREGKWSTFTLSRLQAVCLFPNLQGLLQKRCQLVLKLQRHKETLTTWHGTHTQQQQTAHDHVRTFF